MNTKNTNEYEECEKDHIRGRGCRLREIGHMGGGAVVMMQWVETQLVLMMQNQANQTKIPVLYQFNPGFYLNI